MRVARIITRLNIGGPSIQAINLSSRLSAYGVETLLIHGSVTNAEGDMAYLLDRADPRPSTLHVRTLQRQLAPRNDARTTWAIYRALRAFQPQLVHTHMAKAGALGRVAALAYNRTVGRRHRARIVHTYHGHVLEGYFGRTATAVFTEIERRLAPLTDRIVAVSSRVADELVDRYRIGRREQYRIVPLGFELDRLAAVDDSVRARARAALQIASDAHVVTTIGRLTAIKDHNLFLEAAERITANDPTALFLIVGDGELRGTIEARASELRIASRVQFLGWRRDLEVVYGATDVFLLTSRNEGTPVALIESLAAGCAAVSTDVGGVRDVIATPDVGLLASPGDPVALARHVAALLGDPSRRRAMGTAGRRFVLERHGLDRLLGDMDALYRDLLV
jgi:glycosyltransferase involved in cell wall biosynthesis